MQRTKAPGGMSGTGASLEDELRELKKRYHLLGTVVTLCVVHFAHIVRMAIRG